jgi:hypothetical protein
LRIFFHLFLLCLLFPGPALSGPVRIVVLPLYQTGAGSAADPETANHYRRALRFINNQLAGHDFEVINPEARQRIEEEYNRLADRARKDSILAARELCRRYQTDIAYLVQLDLRTSRDTNGLCRAVVTMEGEGHDSAGRSLGAGLQQTVTRTNQDCEQAIILAEKEVGDLIGRSLTGVPPVQANPPLSESNPLEQQPAKDLEQAGRNLIARLAFAYTGPGFGLNLEPAMPAGAGQAGLRLAGKLDPLLAQAVDTSPNLPVSRIPTRAYTLRPGYSLTNTMLELEARLLDQNGTVKATATTSLAREYIDPALLKPWVYQAPVVCTTYRPGQSPAPAEAGQFMGQVNRILANIGVAAGNCTAADQGIQVIGELDLAESGNSDFALVRAMVRVEALDRNGLTLGLFENEKSSPFTSSRDRAAGQAVRSALQGLDLALTRALQGRGTPPSRPE